LDLDMDKVIIYKVIKFVINYIEKKMGPRPTRKPAVLNRITHGLKSPTHTDKQN
jgi:hypothetical protein